MACCILILLWVRDETSFDAFHAKADDIYRVLQEVKFSDHEATWASTQGPLGPGLEKELPEVVQAVRFRDRRCQIRRGDVWETEWVTLADPSILGVHSLSPPMCGASWTSSVSRKNSRQIFSRRRGRGRTLRLDDRFGFASPASKPIPRIPISSSTSRALLFTGRSA
jgi:putative ABC transport system permease protein